MFKAALALVCREEKTRVPVSGSSDNFRDVSWFHRVLTSKILCELMEGSTERHIKEDTTLHAKR